MTSSFSVIRYLKALSFATGLSVIAASASAASPPPEVADLSQRLARLYQQPELMDAAPFERLQAQQAIEFLSNAKKKEFPDALYLAQLRVQIAETAAKNEVMQTESTALEKTRQQLLLDISRRDAENARQDAERLRVQAQLQAEEAELLKQRADAESQARQDAETALQEGVAGQQTVKLNAARQREIRLAREEAELVAGKKLPNSRFEARGEVFSLASTVFNKQAGLETLGKDQMAALAAYLAIQHKGKLRITAYHADSTLAGQRAEALKQALVAKGVSANRVQVTLGKAPNAGQKQSAEIVIAPQS